MNSEEKNNLIKAGQITIKVKKYAREIIKKDVPLLEIANKIEDKIHELGGKIAFPTNLSINEIAAHYTPSADDKTLASGLLKIDIGVHINGFIADTAFTLDLENSEINKQLIQASEFGLSSGIKSLKSNPEISLGELGKNIQKEIEKNNCQPIVNLTGHSLDQYELHSGITLQNTETTNENYLPEGAYAIEPFATEKTASGRVKDGNPSGIYLLQDLKQIRNPTARKVLDYIKENYSTLPFCSRWLVNSKKFSIPEVKIALFQLEKNENLHQFSQLVESSKKRVAQSEHTVIIDEDSKEKVVVSTG
ncbi:MAG: type II methionyl aminopeptidase [Nanoarchaeota archaeon]